MYCTQKVQMKIQHRNIYKKRYHRRRLIATKYIQVISVRNITAKLHMNVYASCMWIKCVSIGSAGIDETLQNWPFYINSQPKLQHTTNLGTSGYTAELRVKVGGFGVLVHNHGTQMIQQRVFVYSVLNFRNLSQVLYLEPFSLEPRNTHFLILKLLFVLKMFL